MTDRTSLTHHFKCNKLHCSKSNTAFIEQFELFNIKIHTEFEADRGVSKIFISVILISIALIPRNIEIP